jgi:hypothetical protein
MLAKLWPLRSIADRCAAELCGKIERDGGFFMLDRHARRL